MTSHISGPLAACYALAERFADATGGHAKADLQVMPEGGVTLKYLQGCPHTSNPTYEVISEDRLSLLRAMDSLALHLSRALTANAEGLELAALTVESTTARTGTVHVHFYCPAWHQAYALPCRYQVQEIPHGKQVALDLIGPTMLTAEQSLGWDRMYDAGLVGHLSAVLPLAAQALAQLFDINDVLDSRARTVVLPGEHRQWSIYRGDAVVLADFDDGSEYLALIPQADTLRVEAPEGHRQLPTPQFKELTAALARWQAICEAVSDTVQEPV
jgi:hypothetical protein